MEPTMLSFDDEVTHIELLRCVCGETLIACCSRRNSHHVLSYSVSGGIDKGQMHLRPDGVWSQCLQTTKATSRLVSGKLIVQ